MGAKFNVSNQILISVVVLAVAVSVSATKRGPNNSNLTFPGILQISGRSNAAILNCAAAISSGRPEQPFVIVCGPWSRGPG